MSGILTEQAEAQIRILGDLVEKNRLTGKTSVLIPVHFAGRPCEMRKIKEIAESNNLHIIEDAAHAIGSNYEDGSKVGNCKYGDMR